MSLMFANKSNFWTHTISNKLGFSNILCYLLGFVVNTKTNPTSFTGIWLSTQNSVTGYLLDGARNTATLTSRNLYPSGIHPPPYFCIHSIQLNNVNNHLVYARHCTWPLPQNQNVNIPNCTYQGYEFLSPVFPIFAHFQISLELRAFFILYLKASALFIFPVHNFMKKKYTSW